MEKEILMTACFARTIDTDWKEGDTVFIYNLKAVANKLKTDYTDVTTHIGHMGEMGACREEILRNYIRQFLPEKFKVGRGFIIDSDGNQSRQQDFIIYDAFNSPKALNMETIQVLPIESVFCTIEVKSTLNKAELEKSIANVRSVRSLKPSVIHNMALEPANTNRPIGLVFAYTSDTSIENMVNNFHELNCTVDYNQQISLICILDKGLILRSKTQVLGNITLYPDQNTSLGYSKDMFETNFYSFCLLLLNTLNLMTNLPPNLMEYAKKEGALDIKTIYPVKYVPNTNPIGFGNGIELSPELLSKIPLLFQKMRRFQKLELHKDELLEFLFFDAQMIADTLSEKKEIRYSQTDFPGIETERIHKLYRKLKNGEAISHEDQGFYDLESTKLYDWYKTNMK